MKDQLDRLMMRVDKAIGEHAEQEPTTPTDGAVFAVHHAASMLARLTPLGAPVCAAVHLRTLSKNPLDALTAIARAYGDDPKMTAAIGAALMVLK